MVTRDGKVLVMDFGIARLISGPETAPQTSAVLGTASYLSPEQAQGHSVDARSDIYALGVVLYEMLTGRPPFTGDSPMAIAYKQVNATPEAPSSVNPEVPPELDAVVMRALSKNPANRYQTGQEFADDLERARTGGQVMATPLLPAAGEATQVISRPQPTSVLPPQQDEPGGSRKAWIGALLAILIIALLAAGGYLVVTMLTDGGDGELVPVPSLIGLTRAEAEQKLDDAGLVLGETKKRPTDRVPPGQVLEQDPLPDRQVKPGSAVDLTFSVPPKRVEVPSLEGATVEDARAQLEAVDLVLGDVVEQNDEEVPEGQIISQSPGAGEQVPKNTPVDVVVSAGRSVIIVPDVTCRTYAGAKAELEGLGLAVELGDSVAPRPECPNSVRVAQQDVPAGSAVPPDTLVVLHQGALPSPSPSPSTSPSP
jgi:eukaryotic-like serine/threonine-protein kinase